jgi:hypothetical protein
VYSFLVPCSMRIDASAALNLSSEWIVRHSYKAQIDPAAPVTS